MSFDAGTERETTYKYDGEGRRVKKVVGIGSLAVTTTFVYDALGRVVSEYETKTAGSETGIKYLTQDHLGSTRIVTNVSKQVKARYDYLPFGEEVASSIGGRSTVTGYTVGDSTRQKFTGKERDKESGLDYFGARYYASPQGRFTSADPLLSSGETHNPQSWNRYSYTLNNPLRYTDPTGMYTFDQSVSADDQKKFNDAYDHARELQKKYKKGSAESLFEK